MLFTEGPNQADFFYNSYVNNFTELPGHVALEGTWTGTYYLDKASIFWVNSNLNKLDFYKLIEFGPYKINFKFVLNSAKKISSLQIEQEDINYGFVNVDIKDKKQVNYWTKALNKNWVEIIRGKVHKINDNELFTIFQTIVYEGKIPIYAFRGETALSKN